MSLERAREWRDRFRPERAGPKLNLMCGKVVLPGFINLDVYPPADLFWRVDPFYPKLPFPDDHLEYVYWNQGPEHIANVDAMIQELWRVSVHGAQWYLETVGWKEPNSYGDPTHFSHWGERILDFYLPEGNGGTRYGPAKITFERIGSDDGTLEWRCTVVKP
jgi:hypothetical protein